MTNSTFEILFNDSRHRSETKKIKNKLQNIFQ